MKYLSRGLAASAAALLLSAGLAGGASAAAADCSVSAGDLSVAEGDSGTSTAKITLTAVAATADQCDGIVVDYTFADGTATSGDYTATAGSVTFGTGEGSQTRTVEATITGDTTAEANETFTIDLTVPDAAESQVTDAQGVVTIVDDDQIEAGGTATVTPTSGRPGTEITVTATKCTEPTGDAALIATTGESGGPVDEDNGNVVTDGTFTAELVVPADADPSATYFVRTTCGTGDAADRYADVAFDVLEKMTGTNGYRMVAGDGGIFTFGERTFHGSTGDMTLNKPIVGGATDTSDYDGYWIVASDGGVFTFSAPFYGSLGGSNITSPAVEIEPHPTGKGYWIVQADGTVTPYGDSKHFGDMKGKSLNKPIIGMSVTTTGMGYWLIAQDGGIFNFGDAEFFGSTGDKKLNAPIIDLAPAVDNQGYYLLGSDGGVFTFGSADFKGSTGDMKLNAPVVAMLVNPTGSGYWLAASDGGIFTFGPGVDFLGSMGGTKLNSPVLDLIN